MGGGSDGGDSTDSGNVSSGNDRRAQDIDLSEFGGGMVGEAGIPDMDQRLDDDDAVDAGTTAGADADADAGGGGGSAAGNAGSEATSLVESVLFEDGDREAFTAEELQREDTARAFADWVAENTNSSLTDEDVEQIQRLAADDLGADVPAHLDLDDATEYKPLISADDPGGASEAGMWIARTDDGTETYVTLDASPTVGDPLEGGRLVQAVSESIPDDAGRATPSFPDAGVDKERGAVVLESAGADDVEPVGRYRDGGDDHDPADHRAAVAGKLLVGDTDIGGNVVTSSDGDFHPIDFDIGGRDLVGADERIAQGTGVLDDPHGGIWEKATSRANSGVRYFDFEHQPEAVAAHTRDIARSIDVDAVERQLTDSPTVSRRTVENVVGTIRAMQEGEL